MKPPSRSQVSNKWVDLEFNVVPYKESKDVFILGAIEDIQVRDAVQGAGGQRRHGVPCGGFRAPGTSQERAHLPALVSPVAVRLLSPLPRPAPFLASHLPPRPGRHWHWQSSHCNRQHGNVLCTP